MALAHQLNKGFLLIYVMSRCENNLCDDVRCVAVTHRFPRTRCDGCDDCTQSMSRSVEKHGSLVVKLNTSQMRLAKVEQHERDSHEWAEWRLKNLVKYGRVSSEASSFLRTFVQWAYKALYREEHPPMDGDADREGVVLHIAPLHRTMGSSNPGPSV